MLICFLGGTFFGAMLAILAVGLARTSKLSDAEADGYLCGYRQGLEAAEWEAASAVGR